MFAVSSDYVFRSLQVPLRLHYAKVGDLDDYLNMMAIRGEVVVQFWLKPGDEIVELSFSTHEKVSTPSVLNSMF